MISIDHILSENSNPVPNYTGILAPEFKKYNKTDHELYSFVYHD